MKTILLYGFLGKKFGKVHHMDVQNPAEAMRALSANFPSFRKDVIEGGSYKVLVGGKSSLLEEDLHNPISNRESIRIVPVVQGSGENPIGRIIVGAALMFFAPYIGAAFSGTGAGAAIGSAAYSFGTALILGGISQLLFQPPEMTSAESADKRASFIFNGSVNVTAQGSPVACCYGRLIVGSVVVSAGLSVEDLAIS